MSASTVESLNREGAPVPDGLAAGGTALWDAITDEHDLSALQLVQLVEACRIKDRLDKLDLVLRLDITTWVRIVDGRTVNDSYLYIDDAVKLANATANILKQLLAALRLPDPVTGRKTRLSGVRGAYAPSSPPAKVSAFDRARAANSA